LKLRVRVLESERAFKRVATMQQTIGQVNHQKKNSASLLIHYPCFLKIFLEVVCHSKFK
jgi:hypothetical protein